MSVGKSLGVDVTATSTSAEHELGLIIQDPAAPQNWYKYVQADDAITQYDAVSLDFAAGGSGSSASVPHLVTRSADVSAPVGVAQVAIAAGSYGFVLVRGEGIVQAETAVAQGDFLCASAVAGELITQPSTAVNPVTADFDDAVASGHGIQCIATEAEGATTVGFASIVIL